MPATLHLVRHAQGYHNLPREPGAPSPYLLPDPDLTAVGREQCAELRRTFPHHEAVTHLVASPLRRTLHTCLLAFAEGRGLAVTALPEVQEVSSMPCDTGSDPAALAREFGDRVDLARVAPGWNDKDPDSPWAPQVRKLDARAAAARVWLRELAASADNPHIVVVTHGGFLHFLTQDWEGMNRDMGTGWKNTEWRSYEFVDETGEDAEARIKETKQSWERRRGDAIPLTEAEQRALKEAASSQLEEEFVRLEEMRSKAAGQSKV